MRSDHTSPRIIMNPPSQHDQKAYPLLCMYKKIKLKLKVRGIPEQNKAS